MAVRRGVLTALQVTDDTVTDGTTDGTATYTTIPITKVLARDFQPWTEEGVTDDGVNQTPGTAGVKGSAQFIVALDKSDTFLADFITADQNRSAVWVKFTYGTESFVAGGSTGCTVVAAKMPGAPFGEVGGTMIQISASNVLAGDTYVELS